MIVIVKALKSEGKKSVWFIPAARNAFVRSNAPALYVMMSFASYAGSNVTVAPVNTVPSGSNTMVCVLKNTVSFS